MSSSHPHSSKRPTSKSADPRNSLNKSLDAKKSKRSFKSVDSKKSKRLFKSVDSNKIDKKSDQLDIKSLEFTIKVEKDAIYRMTKKARMMNHMFYNNLLRHRYYQLPYFDYMYLDPSEIDNVVPSPVTQLLKRQLPKGQHTFVFLFAGMGDILLLWENCIKKAVFYEPLGALRECLSKNIRLTTVKNKKIVSKLSEFGKGDVLYCDLTRWPVKSISQIDEADEFISALTQM